jgi:hypothetical protein
MSDLSSYRQDRENHRHLIHADVDVYDRLRDIYLGRLVNIHSHGLMIVGDVALTEDRLYELDMHIPATNNQKQLIKLGVDCLWVREADQQGKYWAGLSLIDVTPESAEEIRKLILCWGQQ